MELECSCLQRLQGEETVFFRHLPTQLEKKPVFWKVEEEELKNVR